MYELVQFFFYIIIVWFSNFLCVKFGSYGNNYMYDVIGLFKNVLLVFIKFVSIIICEEVVVFLIKG